MDPYLPLMRRLFVLSALLLLGACGTSRVGLGFDLEQEALAPIDPAPPRATVVEVRDARAVPNEIVGIGRTGVFNRVTPVDTREPVANLVRLAVQRVLGDGVYRVDADTEARSVAVAVTVDTLLVWERHGLLGESACAKSALRFHVLERDRSPITVRTRAEVEHAASFDATGSLQIALGQALAACTRDFVDSLLRERAAALVSTDDRSALADLSALAATVQVAPVEVSATSSQPGPPAHRDEVALIGFTGTDRIEYGGALVWQRMFQQRDSARELGIGLGLRYVQLEDTAEFRDGRFAGLAAPITFRAFRDPRRAGGYLGASLQLLSGTESVEGSDEASFFFGAMTELVLGWRAGALGVEGGGFWMGLLGSDLLDRDLGVRAGITLRIGSKGPPPLRP